MKFKFKIQQYQTEAVSAVVDCFAGQPNTSGMAYRIDPGSNQQSINMDLEQTGFRNADLRLSETQLLANIQSVQRRQNLPLSNALVSRAGCTINLDVEM